MEGERKKPTWRQTKKVEREWSSEQDRNRMKRVWLQCCLYLETREQGPLLCPVYLFNADRGRDTGRGGVLFWSGKVTECAHWKATMSALISLWHNKTIRGGPLTKLDYSASLLSTIWRVISWDSSTQGMAQHYEIFNHCTMVGYLLRGVLWNALHPLDHPEFPVTKTQTTHSVVAVLTQVIASNEEGH